MASETSSASRLPVESTAIRAVNYYPHISMLELEFEDSSVYLYFDIPPDVYKALLRAESAGQYFNATVRGTYRFVKVS